MLIRNQPQQASTQAYVCYDGKKFWLAGWGGEWQKTVDTTGETLRPDQKPSAWSFGASLKGLTGIETLNGTGWGTLKTSDLVTR